jgi:hypothetical protein
MKYLISTTALLVFLLFQTMTALSAQSLGQLMPASGPGDVLVINEDGSNHFSRIRMQTRYSGGTSGWTLRNNNYDFGLEIWRSGTSNQEDYGQRLLEINEYGELLTKHDAAILNLSKLSGRSSRDLTLGGSNLSPTLSQLKLKRTSGDIQIPGTLTVGFSFLPVPGTALTVDGRVHISAEGGDQEANFDAQRYSDFLLWTDGGIVAEDFAIDDSDDWADFVFEEGYQLPTLEEVESFIGDHGHLPTIPSEEEVKKGYDIHTMNKQLLQTAEELVLHTIDQNKSIQQLRKRVNELKRK